MAYGLSKGIPSISAASEVRGPGKAWTSVTDPCCTHMRVSFVTTNNENLFMRCASKSETLGSTRVNCDTHIAPRGKDIIHSFIPLITEFLVSLSLLKEASNSRQRQVLLDASIVGGPQLFCRFSGNAAGKSLPVSWCLFFQCAIVKTMVSD